MAKFRRLCSPPDRRGAAREFVFEGRAGDAQFQALAALGAPQAVEVGEQREVLGDRELCVEGQLLWHQAQAARAVPANLALLQGQGIAEQGEQGRLARAVAAEQAQALAFLQLQVDPLQCQGIGTGVAETDTTQLKHERVPAAVCRPAGAAGRHGWRRHRVRRPGSVPLVGH